MSPLKLAVFDFDRTLSACHVFYTLVGGDGGLPVPPPYARTERGQLTRIAELDALPEMRAQGGFAVAAFGGPERVAWLRAIMEELQKAGIESIICSRGFVGPINKCLDQAGLKGYFTQIFANADSPDGSVPSLMPPNATPYDLHCLANGAPGPDQRFMGGAANSGWGSKGKLITRALSERGLRGSQAVFIDDTQSEIASVQPVCLTIQVQSPYGVGQPQGMSQPELDMLRCMLRGDFEAPAEMPASASGRSSNAGPWGRPAREGDASASPHGSFAPEPGALAGSSFGRRGPTGPTGPTPDRHSAGDMTRDRREDRREEWRDENQDSNRMSGGKGGGPPRQRWSEAERWGQRQPPPTGEEEWWASPEKPPPPAPPPPPTRDSHWAPPGNLEGARGDGRRQQGATSDIGGFLQALGFGAESGDGGTAEGYGPPAPGRGSGRQRHGHENGHPNLGYTPAAPSPAPDWLALRNNARGPSKGNTLCALGAGLRGRNGESTEDADQLTVPVCCLLQTGKAPGPVRAQQVAPCSVQ